MSNNGVVRTRTGERPIASKWPLDAAEVPREEKSSLGLRFSRRANLGQRAPGLPSRPREAWSRFSRARLTPAREAETA